jgi:hypothetical protein
MKPANNYIDNVEFTRQLIEHKNRILEAERLGLPKPRANNYIGDCFLKIANNLAKRPNFFSYSYKDEMISDAIENCILYYENFDPDKSNKPFAYFTKICWYAFVRRIAKEKKQQYVKYKASESFGVLGEEEMEELDDATRAQIQIYDNMYEFISTYEEKNLTKKEPVKEVAKGVEKFFDE